MTKEKICILLCQIIFGLTFSDIAAANSVVGSWEWNESPGTRTFSIDIEQSERSLSGQYCAIAENGNKIDCDDERNRNITGVTSESGRSAVIEFSSFFGGHGGKAILEMSGDRLIWHIVKSPVGGAFYAPENAVLDRH